MNWFEYAASAARAAGERVNPEARIHELKSRAKKFREEANRYMDLIRSLDTVSSHGGTECERLVHQSNLDCLMSETRRKERRSHLQARICSRRAVETALRLRAELPESVWINDNNDVVVEGICVGWVVPQQDCVDLTVINGDGNVELYRPGVSAKEALWLAWVAS